MNRVLGLILLCFVLVSCEKDDPGSSMNPPSPPSNPQPPTPPPPPPGDPSMVIYIDGEEVQVGNTIAYIEKYDQLALDYRFMVVRSSFDFSNLTISVQNYDWMNPPEDGIVTKMYNTNIFGDQGEYTDCSGGPCDYAFDQVAFDLSGSSKPTYTSELERRIWSGGDLIC